jgi:MAE_28990/MAE_18760-like HEPN
MSKSSKNTAPKTLLLLNDAIAAEYKWRIIELSNFKSTVLELNPERQKSLIRAGVALLYAHWEGFVKKVADLYYEFVGYQRCTLAELNDCFVSIALKQEMELLQNTKKLSIQNEVLKIFFEKQNTVPHFAAASPIRTANLKYDIFEDVCILIGIDIENFKNKYRRSGKNRDIQKTIDKDLVEKRNYIAHGDYLPIGIKEYTELYDFVVNGMLYHFKEEVLESAINEAYKRKHRKPKNE